MREYWSLLILISLALFSCSGNEDKQPIRSGPAEFNITGQPGIEYTISTIDPLNLSEVPLEINTLDTAGTGTHTFDIEEPQFIQVQSSLSSNRILLVPGTTINMSIDDDPSSFTGDLADANTAIIKVQEAEELFFQDPPYYSLDPDSFQERSKAVEQEMISALNDVEETDIRQILEALIDSKLLLMKKQYVISLNEKNQDLPDNSFYNDVFQQMADNTDVLLSAGSWEVATILHLFLEKKVITETRKSEDEPASETAKFVYDEIQNLSISENQKAFLEAKNLMIGFGKVGMTTAMEDLYSQYTDDYPNSGYNEILGAYLDLWKAIAPGKKAPDVAGTTLGADTVRLSDNLGEPVLLIVWASWCEPCIDQFKILGEIKDDLNDNIKYVFYSVDQERAAWEEALDNENVPTGVHLIELLEDREDDIWGKYLITDLPRYILISEDGSIIDPVAPIPGTGMLKQTIQEVISPVQ